MPILASANTVETLGGVESGGKRNGESVKASAAAAAAAASPAEHAAATRLQRQLVALLYGKRARAYVLHTIVYNYAAGSVDEAARYAMSRLVRQPDGRPIPIDCDADAFAPFGGEVHAYVSFVQRACGVFLLCFLLSLAQLLNNLKGGDMGGDLNPLSALSLGNLRRLQISNAVSELVISGVLVHFLFAARRAEIVGSIEARAAEVTPADFSVLIRGLSPDTRDAASVAELIGSLGVRRHEIVALTLSADLRGLILLTRQREAVKREENTLLARCFLLRRELRAIRAGRLRELSDLHAATPQRSGVASWQTGARTTRAADEVESELRASRRRLSEVSAAVLDLAYQKRCLLAAGHRCTGHAYVTFNTESAAEQCIAVVNSWRASETTKQPLGLTPEDALSHDLSAERPPEPEEVYWDELQFGRSHVIRGHLQAGAMILAVALLGTAVITVANYGMGPVMRAAEGPWLKVAGMQVGFTVMIILGNIFIFVLTPILADKLEHHHTFGSKQLSCFLKMYIFQVFNTVVASTVFYFWAEPARHSWYAYGSSMVFNVLIGDTFVISILLDALQPAVLVARHLRAPRASCQREMNELYACQADIYVGFRLQLVAKFITITLIYSSALPLAYGLGAFFLWLGLWIDRVNLLRRLEPPPRSPDRLISVVLQYVLPVAIGGHLLTSLMFYHSELRLAETDPLCDAHGVVEAGVFQSTFLDGNSSVVEAFERSLGLTSTREQQQPCQTAGTLQEARISVAIVGCSAVLWGCFLLRYAFRECARRTERGLHVVSSAEGVGVVAGFLEMGFAEESASDLLHQEPAMSADHRSRRQGWDSGSSRQRLYLPPLPRSVVRRLQTVSDSPSGLRQPSFSRPGQLL